MVWQWHLISLLQEGYEMHYVTETVYLLCALSYVIPCVIIHHNRDEYLALLYITC